MDVVNDQVNSIGWTVEQTLDYIKERGQSFNFEEVEYAVLSGNDHNCGGCQLFDKDDCQCQAVVGASDDGVCDLHIGKLNAPEEIMGQNYVDSRTEAERAKDAEIEKMGVLTTDADGKMMIVGPIDDEKAVTVDEIVSTFVPFGVTSFDELDTAQDAKAAAQKVASLADQFKSIVSNIMMDPDIEDKGFEVVALASEFANRIELATEQKEKWQPLTDAIVTKFDELKQKPMKTEGGVKFPSSDFAFVPDAEKPSTWKLRLAEGRPGNVTVKQLGRAAAAFSSGGFRGRRVQIPSSKVAGVKSKIRAAYRKLGVKDADIPESIKAVGLTIWKETDGSYRWFAVHSNNYRDDDHPPEILSAEAHKEFVSAVDAGDWPYPSFQLWHLPQTKCASTDFVAYDENTGFALSSGLFDKDKQHLAEALACMPNLRVSHGMPGHTVQRDKEDPTIITSYRTAEISALPDYAAANKLTGFVILQEEKSMSIPEHKREFLEQAGLDVDVLENQLESGKEKADELGLESKDVDTEDKDTETEVTEVETVESTTEVAKTVEPVTELTMDTTVFVAAIAEGLQPLVDRIDAIEDQIKQLSESSQPDSESEKGTKDPASELTPSASVASMIRTAVIGLDQTRVDGRKTLAKDGPKETAAPSPSRTGVPFMDDMLNGKDWRESMDITN